MSTRTDVIWMFVEELKPPSHYVRARDARPRTRTYTGIRMRCNRARWFLRLYMYSTMIAATGVRACTFTHKSSSVARFLLQYHAVPRSSTDGHAHVHVISTTATTVASSIYGYRTCKTKTYRIKLKLKVCECAEKSSNEKAEKSFQI